MESYIVRIYRRPELTALGGCARTVPHAALVLQAALPADALAGTVQALGGGSVQAFDSAQALLKGLGLEGTVNGTGKGTGKGADGAS